MLDGRNDGTLAVEGVTLRRRDRSLLSELWLHVEPGELVALSEASGVPPPVIGQVIPRLNLEVVPAAEAQEELEEFFGQLATLSPDIIGGGLPDAAFYLPDPR